ncbi:LOW QUALITY PROTEIN: sucrase-isomaltase, intestinal-like [Acanthochromis polyacanthus]|uniref:LOW QUALITY PROTEIN: sucrase-isomaltase, intestinal-like n=1 Tax=Acanthochromis polyacanthus TaxID=80966 RepID=UPI002234925D|nr:LOW QUALITY PROTEIN: sucrase-isomaltase, intestinal-like [Acanthochromis polyacanthus]
MTAAALTLIILFATQPSVTKEELTARLKRMNSPSLFGGDIQELIFQAEMQTSNRLHFKIYDSNNQRFEVPHEHVRTVSNNPTTPLNDALSIRKESFGLTVRRSDTNKVLFDTTMAPLVFADQYLQLSAKLPSHNIYGLGEHVHQHYRHDTNWRTWPIFTRDGFPNGGTHNLYGHYPFFLCLEDNSGRSFGVFLMNSNAMEVTLQPAPAVTFRTIGGVLDFYIVFGQTPEQVVSEFLELIGRPVIPVYWSLGFQLSRWNYGSLAEVKATVERNRAINLPYDVQYTDIDYMEDKKIFTYDKVKFAELPQFADYLSEKGQKYILILDPAVATSKRVGNTAYEAYDRGTAAGAWVTYSDGKTPLLGEVWPGETVVFQITTSQKCIDWWIDGVPRLYTEIKHDALWIDMNEVSNFIKGSVKGCDDNNLNYPPFTPRILDDVMYSKTLCMDAKQAWGNHYDVHSLYGYSMVLASHRALQRVFGNSRSLLLTRSSFPGVGKYSGHWLGDNAANWNDIKWAIPGMLEFGLFGIPYIGADICGFFDDSSEDLCRRWMQVGAFYPFSRNHNAEGYRPQDPAYYGADSMLVASSKHYLTIRLHTAAYLYTLFYKAHTAGETVVRPVLHEFYDDENTWTVDRQFLWGKYLLITPVLDPGKEDVWAYIPDAKWYDYDTMVPLTERKKHVNMHVPAEKLGLHIRGGAILPTQRPEVTLTYSRRNPMGLIIALDDNNQAAGELFWDDGDSRDTVKNGNYTHYNFSVVDGLLIMQVSRAGYDDPNNLKFEDITVLGIPQSPASVTVTHVPAGGGENTVTTLLDTQIEHDFDKEVLFLRNLSLIFGDTYLIEWQLAKEYQRIDCHPEKNADEAKCTARGCIWQLSAVPNVPACYYPDDYGYTVSTVSETVSGMTLDITRNVKYRSSGRPDSPDMDKLRVAIYYHTSDMLQFKIWDPATDRYEVPVPLSVPSTPETDAAKRLYEVKYTNNPFGIQVIRKSTNAVIWDSSLPGFIFSNMFIQVSTRLPSRYVYGFGETEHISYRHDLDYKTYGMFSKDQPPGYKLNSYGVHPFYMGVENTADAHGVLLLNSNAMDVTFQPTPSITYRTLGGILDFYMVLGPTPEMVVQEYTALIGRPVLPAYWSLGFQLCRYGYANDLEIENLYNDMRAAGIPYDVQYADIDHMERQLDFVLDHNFQGLPALVDKMRAEGMRFIPILDPAISGNETNYYPAFERGIAADIFIKWPKELSDEIVWGKVWPDYPNVTVDDSPDWDTAVELYRSYAAFPDFFRSETAAWWHQEIKDYYEKTVKFDGLWIDMNEPASFVHGTVGGNCLGNPLLENPPYMPPLESSHMGLNHKTLCMNSEQILSDGRRVKHYDVHNLYGWSHAKPTYDTLLEVTGKRGIVVSRSTYPSSGKWVGHWLGDNNSSWDQLFKSIIGMLEFSLFGISYTGADICGYFNPSNYEMCLRWMQLGAFYPYSRNHNGNNLRQDPVAWNATFAEISRDVLNVRYTLLPYLYTLLYEAHVDGSTVVRPLLHEFVEDRNTWDVHRQFLWGPALLITPVLDPGHTTVEGYFPKARWYDYYTAELYHARGESTLLSAPLDHINLHIRGGYILPCQAPARNTQESRKNPLGLIVALSETGTAEGSFFWDDGEGIDTVKNNQYLLTSFSATGNTLTCNIVHNGLAQADQVTLGVVKVWGAGNVKITGATLKDASGTSYPLTLQHDVTKQELIMDATSRSFIINQHFTITWITSV